jgi:Ca2+-binding EF-hand superfamily protein
MSRSFVTALSLSLIASCLVAIPAMGAEKGKKKKADPDAAFARLDKDNDKKLSLDEFKGKRDADKAGKAFKKLDKDNDGSLSLAEFKDRAKKK